MEILLGDLLLLAAAVDVGGEAGHRRVGDVVVLGQSRRLALRAGDLDEVLEPFETPPDSKLATGLDAACRSAVGRGPEPVGVPAWTDAHNFVAFGGAEAVVFGPGEFATAHTRDEHIDAGAVVECAAVFARLAWQGWRVRAG